MLYKPECRSIPYMNHTLYLVPYKLEYIIYFICEARSVLLISANTLDGNIGPECTISTRIPYYFLYLNNVPYDFLYKPKYNTISYIDHVLYYSSTCT